MEAKEYVNLLFPNGRAYAGVEDSDKFNEVIALQIERVLSWVQDFQDQLWFANDNFDPEPWEQRYDINVPVGATLEERRQVVKSYMIFPQREERMSLDYLQEQLDNAGFDTVIIERNPTGSSEGILHGNNITNDENYNVGPDTYNSIRLTGEIGGSYYQDMLRLIMSLRPLETAIWDLVEINQALAIDDSLALAIDDNYALAIDVL